MAKTKDGYIIDDSILDKPITVEELLQYIDDVIDNNKVKPE